MTRSLILSSLLSSSFASPRSASFSHSAIVASSHARFRFRLHPASLNPNLTGSPSVSFAKSLSFSTLVTSVAVTSRASSLQRISTAYKSSFQTSAHCFPSFLRFYSSSTLKPISTSSTSVSTMRIIPVPVLKGKEKKKEKQGEKPVSQSVNCGIFLFLTPHDLHQKPHHRQLCIHHPRRKDV